MPRNTAANNMRNGVKSLPLQLRCHCIPDHNKFSYLSNNAVVVIFPNLCSWRHSFLLKLERYWPWKTLPSHLKNDPKWRLIEWHVLTSFKKVFIGPEGLWRLWEQSETQYIVIFLRVSGVKQRLCHLRWIKEWVLVTCLKEKSTIKK